MKMCGRDGDFYVPISAMAMTLKKAQAAYP
jgi:hypothetical protein